MLELICTRTCGTCRKTVALLEDRGIAYRYREYREEPLSEQEIRELLELLGVEPAQVLRRQDRAFQDLGLSGKEEAGELIRHMAHHPTLLQRPIAVLGRRAVVGRPPERVLELLEESVQ